MLQLHRVTDPMSGTCSVLSFKTLFVYSLFCVKLFSRFGKYFTVTPHGMAVTLGHLVSDSP